MGEVKDIVETVTISVGDVVGERIADHDPVHLKDASTATALTDHDLEMVGQTLILAEILVERRKLGSHGIEKAAAHLPDVRICDLRERYLSGPEGLEKRVGKSRYLLCDVS